MDQKKLLGKKVLYRMLAGRAIGKVEKIIDEENVKVRVGDNILAKVNVRDIIKVY